MQHRLLEEYVAEVTPRRATDVETKLDAEELSQHLGALADVHVELGMTEDEAAREAIRQFGAAPAVRHDLKRVSLRGRLVKAARTNAGTALLTGFAIAAPSLFATFAANTFAPPQMVTALLAQPHTAVSSTVVTGVYFPLLALLAGMVLALRRGERLAVSLIPIAAAIATLLPFVMVSPARGSLSSWPSTPQVWGYLSYTYLCLMAYAYVGALAVGLWRRHRQKGGPATA